MATYRPDEWVMLKITTEKYGVIYKIFAGWGGGSASGDSWKLSSGCESVKKSRVKKMSGSYQELVAPQSSGSTYYLRYNSEGGQYQGSFYGVRGWRYSVLTDVIEQLSALGASVEIIPAGTDFEAIDYSVARPNTSTN